MKRSKIASAMLKGAVLGILLLGAEFILPNYVSRIGTRLVTDIGHMLGANDNSQAVVTDDAVRSNEFAFAFVALDDARTQRPAGVLGPDADGHFLIVDQSDTRVAGHDLTPILDQLSARYGDTERGGLKQVIEIDGALFALLGLVRGECPFAALVDLARMAIVDEFPCIPETLGNVNLRGIGGGYSVMDDDTILIALGTGSHLAWSAGNTDAQNPASPYGKILRYDIERDADGPRLTNRRIITSGHRNPQGMTRLGDMVLAVEHGPHGGDELNLIEAGANYGWPLFSAGSQYNQRDLTSFSPDGSDYTNPIYTFVPSIAASDISPCPSLLSARYASADCVIISGLISEAIFIVLGDFANQRVWSVERVPVGARIREVFVHDDTLYLVSDQSDMLRADIAALPCISDDGPCESVQ